MAIAIPFAEGANILSLGTAGQWTTITLPGVPASATGVIVDFYGGTNSANAQGAIRTIGHTHTSSTAYTLGTNGTGQQVNSGQHWAELDGSNQVEMWINAATTYARIVGWLEDGDVTFLSNQTNMWSYLESGDGATPESDHVFDLSTISGGASAALVVCQGTTIAGTAKYNWKRPAENYWRANPRRGNTVTTFVYPLDGSGKVTFKFSHFTPSFTVVGFMGVNFTPYTTEPEKVQINSSNWETATLTGTSQGAIVAVLDRDALGSVWGGAQMVGDADRGTPDFWGYGSQYFIGLNGTKQYRHMYVDAVYAPFYTYAIGWFGPATAPTTPSISDVGGTDIITHMTSFTINGSFPQTITEVKLIDGAMETVCSITSQSATNVICDPYDVFAGDPDFGTVTVSVTDGVDTDTHDVTLISGNDYANVVLAGTLIARGVDTDTVAGIGDQIAIAETSGINTTMSANADVKFDPATINGTVIERQAHDGSTWTEDTITIYRGSFTGVEWTGVPNPPNGVVGKQYDYAFGGFITGDRPIDFSLATGELPEGLVIDSDNEKITGIPLEAITFTGISIFADNGAGAQTIQVLGDDV